MASVASVGRIFKLAVLTAAMLALACPQAWSAGSGMLFNETWKDKDKCARLRGTSGTICDEVSGGKFTIQTTISDSSSFASGTLTPALLTTGSNTFSLTLGGYSFSDLMSDFTIKSGANEASATQPNFAESCNLQGKCKQIKVQDVTLKINNKGELEITITAVTGYDAQGDFFENSIDAENFDGDNSGPLVDNLFLQVDLGSFSFNDGQTDNVAVTGTVQTKPGKHAGSSSFGTVSNIKTKGTLSQ